MGSLLYLLPLVVFVLFPATFIVTYCISVILGHTEPDFPYISDTGTYSPESCIFGQALNVGACLTFCTFYIRYCQIAEFYKRHSPSSSVVRLNRAALLFGSASALGISIAANFQETNVFYVHLFGSLLAFGGGTVYIWLQAICSYQMHPLMNSIAVAHLRLGIAVLTTLAFIVGSICAILSHYYFDGPDATKWYPEDGGWEFHVASTASEWVCFLSFDFFMLSLVGEFKRISIEHPQVSVPIDWLDSPIYTPGNDSTNSDSGSGELHSILAPSPVS